MNSDAASWLRRVEQDVRRGVHDVRVEELVGDELVVGPVVKMPSGLPKVLKGRFWPTPWTVSVVRIISSLVPDEAARSASARCRTSEDLLRRTSPSPRGARPRGGRPGRGCSVTSFSLTLIFQAGNEEWRIQCSVSTWANLVCAPLSTLRCLSTHALRDSSSVLSSVSTIGSLHFGHRILPMPRQHSWPQIASHLCGSFVPQIFSVLQSLLGHGSRPVPLHS